MLEDHEAGCPINKGVPHCDCAFGRQFIDDARRKMAKVAADAHDEHRKPSSTPSQKSFNLHGLSWNDAQYAIYKYASEKRAAVQRGKDQRAQYEASLRRQGFDEAYIRSH